MPLSVSEARLISLAAQRLDLLPRPKSPDRETLLEMIRHLGCVQLDSISVVSRSHETVIWSRFGSYDPTLFSDLYHPVALINEYWAHAAAIVPVESLPYFRRHMNRYRDPGSPDYARWEPDAAVNEMVMSTIRERGPLPSRAFERPEGPRPESWSWWGAKPANKALDFLWTSGDLTILKREAFQRVYELTERRLPGFHEADLPSEAEQRRFFVTRALTAMGVATKHWVTDYFRSGGRAHVPVAHSPRELAQLAAEGLAIPVSLPTSTEPAWMDATLLPLLDEIRAGAMEATRTTLLSPFDSLVWHRERALTLFDFDYRLESYTPGPKRRYGYYTLPILHRGRLVGRLDPSYDRKRRILTVKALHLEPGTAVTRTLGRELMNAIIEFCAFLGGTDSQILVTVPDDLSRHLKREA